MKTDLARQRTRALSFRAAARCEHAIYSTCRCRCAGRNHGKARLSANASRDDYATLLPTDDPHRLPEKKETRP